ncbi:unnamed protein product [Owenia fusiformis]|uniref:Uncharacterized protein n=1 Tax=Owenia fusiformis TaxID=6347 RepID=A0A8J1YB62_OWEFU|nr:unnamed protein product [Owenia fusiformis]
MAEIPNCSNFPGFSSKEMGKPEEQDPTQDYIMLKQKIIQTDMLIKKYSSKCQDYEAASKKLEDTSKKFDKTQRDLESVETQLKACLQEIEPIKKSKMKLEKQRDFQNTLIQDLQEKLNSSEALCKMYESVRHEAEKSSQKVTQEIQSKESTVQELQQQNKKNNSKIHKLESELQKVKADLVEQKKLLHQSNLENKRLEAQVKKMKDKATNHCFSPQRPSPRKLSPRKQQKLSPKRQSLSPRKHQKKVPYHQGADLMSLQPKQRNCTEPEDQMHSDIDDAASTVSDYNDDIERVFRHYGTALLGNLAAVSPLPESGDEAGSSISSSDAESLSQFASQLEAEIDEPTNQDPSISDKLEREAPSNSSHLWKKTIDSSLIKSSAMKHLNLSESETSNDSAPSEPFVTPSEHSESSNEQMGIKNEQYSHIDPVAHDIDPSIDNVDKDMDLSIKDKNPFFNQKQSNKDKASPLHENEAPPPQNEPFKSINDTSDDGPVLDRKGSQQFEVTLLDELRTTYAEPDTTIQEGSKPSSGKHSTVATGDSDSPIVTSRQRHSTAIEEPAMALAKMIGSLSDSSGDEETNITNDSTLKATSLESDKTLSESDSDNKSEHTKSKPDSTSKQTMNSKLSDKHNKTPGVGRRKVKVLADDSPDLMKQMTRSKSLTRLTTGRRNAELSRSKSLIKTLADVAEVEQEENEANANDGDVTEGDQKMNDAEANVADVSESKEVDREGNVVKAKDAVHADVTEGNQEVNDPKLSDVDGTKGDAEVHGAKENNLVDVDAADVTECDEEIEPKTIDIVKANVTESSQEEIEPKSKETVDEDVTEGDEEGNNPKATLDGEKLDVVTNEAQIKQTKLNDSDDAKAKDTKENENEDELTLTFRKTKRLTRQSLKKQKTLKRQNENVQDEIEDANQTSSSTRIKPNDDIENDTYTVDDVSKPNSLNDPVKSKQVKDIPSDFSVINSNATSDKKTIGNPAIDAKEGCESIEAVGPEIPRKCTRSRSKASNSESTDTPHTPSRVTGSNNETNDTTHTPSRVTRSNSESDTPHTPSRVTRSNSESTDTPHTPSRVTRSKKAPLTPKLGDRTPITPSPPKSNIDHLNPIHKTESNQAGVTQEKNQTKTTTTPKPIKPDDHNVSVEANTERNKQNTRDKVAPKSTTPTRITRSRKDKSPSSDNNITTKSPLTPKHTRTRRKKEDESQLDGNDNVNAIVNNESDDTVVIADNENAATNADSENTSTVSDNNRIPVVAQNVNPVTNTQNIEAKDNIMETLKCEKDMDSTSINNLEKVKEESKIDTKTNLKCEQTKINPENSDTINKTATTKKSEDSTIIKEDRIYETTELKDHKTSSQSTLNASTLNIEKSENKTVDSVENDDAVTTEAKKTDDVDDIIGSSEAECSELKDDRTPPECTLDASILSTDDNEKSRDKAAIEKDKKENNTIDTLGKSVDANESINSTKPAISDSITNSDLKANTKITNSCDQTLSNVDDILPSDNDHSPVVDDPLPDENNSLIDSHDSVDSPSRELDLGGTQKFEVSLEKIYSTTDRNEQEQPKVFLATKNSNDVDLSDTDVAKETINSTKIRTLPEKTISQTLVYVPTKEEMEVNNLNNPPPIKRVSKSAVTVVSPECSGIPANDSNRAFTPGSNDSNDSNQSNDSLYSVGKHSFVSNLPMSPQENLSVVSPVSSLPSNAELPLSPLSTSPIEELQDAVSPFREGLIDNNVGHSPIRTPSIFSSMTLLPAISPLPGTPNPKRNKKRPPKSPSPHVFHTHAPVGAIQVKPHPIEKITTIVGEGEHEGVNWKTTKGKQNTVMEQVSSGNLSSRAAALQILKSKKGKKSKKLEIFNKDELESRGIQAQKAQIVVRLQQANVKKVFNEHEVPSVGHTGKSLDHVEVDKQSKSKQKLKRKSQETLTHDQPKCAKNDAGDKPGRKTRKRKSGETIQGINFVPSSETDERAPKKKKQRGKKGEAEATVAASDNSSVKKNIKQMSYAVGKTIADTQIRKYSRDNLIKLPEVLKALRNVPIETISERLAQSVHTFEADLMLTLFTRCSGKGEVNTPILVEHDVRLLHLVDHLGTEHPDVEFVDMVLHNLEVCFKKKLGVIVLGKVSICRFYAALCRHHGNLERARVFAYNVLKNKYSGFMPGLTAMAAVWPDIFNHRGKGRNIGVAFEHILMSCLDSTKQKHAKILKVLTRILDWKPPKLTNERLFGVFIKSLEVSADKKPCNDDYLFGDCAAIELLSKFSTWVEIDCALLQKHILPTIDNYLTLLGDKNNDVTKEIPNAVECHVKHLVHLLGELLYGAPPSEKVNVCNMVNTLSGVLEYTEIVPQEISEAVIETLLKLSPYQPVVIATKCYKWTNSTTKVISKHIQDLIEIFWDFYKDDLCYIPRPVFETNDT